MIKTFGKPVDPEKKKALLDKLEAEKENFLKQRQSGRDNSLEQDGLDQEL